MVWRKIAAFVAAVYLLIVVLCSCTLFWQGAVPELMNKLTKTVVFEEGARKLTSSELNIVLHEGETALLSEFTALKKADFSGSDNLDEIIAWAAANPQVSVSYDILLPDGSRVPSTASSLNFSGITNANLAEYLRCLNYLSNASQIDLGRQSTSTDPLSTDNLSQLIEAYPSVYFKYEFELLGQSCNLDVQSLDLSGISPEQVDSAAKYLGCLKYLSTINLGSEQSSGLSWDDVAKIARSAPAATLDYSF